MDCQVLEDSGVLGTAVVCEVGQIPGNLNVLSASDRRTYVTCCWVSEEDNYCRYY